MKKNRNVKIVLIVFTVVALMYTAYMLVRSYQTVLAYYGSDVTVDVIADYLLQTCFQPLMTAVILYALSCLFDRSKESKEKESKEEVKNETVEEPKEKDIEK